MSLFLCELKKLFVKRRFALVVLALLAIETLSFCVSLDKKIALDDTSAEVYKAYMAQYGGELTEEKIDEIEAVIVERNHYENQKNELKQQFISGGLTLSEYKTETALLKEKMKGTDGFNKFVSAFRTAEFEEQYLTDTSVWDVLFGEGGIDVFLLFGILLMVTALTVYDEEIGINKLKFTAKNGKSALISLQIGTAVVVSIFLPVLIFTEKFLIAKCFYGLDGFENSLSAAENFIYSSWDLTLTQGYVVISLVKTAGCVYLALLTMMIGQICRSSLYTVFTGLIAVYVPAYVLSASRVKFYLPLPSTLLSANGYFSSAELANLSVDENGEMILLSFTQKQLALIFAAAGAVILALIAANRLLWTKRKEAAQ